MFLKGIIVNFLKFTLYSVLVMLYNKYVLQSDFSITTPMLCMIFDISSQFYVLNKKMDLDK